MAEISLDNFLGTTEPVAKPEQQDNVISLNDFLKINKTHYIDLEHLFFKHFRNHKHTIFLNLINVFGRLGSSGTFIYK